MMESKSYRVKCIVYQLVLEANEEGAAWHVDSETDFDENLCQVCGISGDLLHCSGCPNTFHAYCLYPAIMKAIPAENGHWFCEYCYKRGFLGNEVLCDMCRTMRAGKHVSKLESESYRATCQAMQLAIDGVREGAAITAQGLAVNEEEEETGSEEEEETEMEETKEEDKEYKNCSKEEEEEETEMEGTED